MSRNRHTGSKSNPGTTGPGNRASTAGPGKAQPLAYGRALQRSSPPAALILLGIVGLLVSVAAAGLLVQERLGGFALPGCGGDGPCATAAKSFWGKIPGIGWPTSYTGFAWFCGLLAAWFACRGRLSGVVQNLVRLGAVGSIALIGAMVHGGYLCHYCIATHVGNLTFLAAAEWAARVTPPPARRTAGLLPLILTFAAVTTPLAILERNAHARGQKQLQDSVDEIKRRMHEREHGGTSQSAPAATQQSANGAAPTTTKPAVGESNPAATQQSTSTATGPAAAPKRPPFTGRYRLGPADAPLRIVMFTDYQCPDCKAIEREVSALQAQHPEISLSVKNFPFCQQCNPYVGRTLHPNACWAARAAETAGILWGNEGFWKMHHWLFDHEGRFETSAQLQGGIREIGHDPAGFEEVMKSPETLALVKKDIEEGHTLGLLRTPMVFINGVEVKGWHIRPNAVTDAVNALLATSPPRGSAEDDQPPPALDKAIDDWAVEPRHTLPPADPSRVMGPADAPVRVVLFGDLLEANSREVDAALRRIAAARKEVQYTFRHFPFDKTCNPAVQDERFPGSCRTAKLALGAAAGGSTNYWKAHLALLSLPAPAAGANLDDAARAAADAARLSALDAAGLDSGLIATAAEEETTRDRLSVDMAAARSIQGQNVSIPLIVINDRLVPRWNLDGRDILEKIIDRAVSEPRP